MARVKVSLSEILDDPNGNDIMGWEVDMFNDILVAKGYETLNGVAFLGGNYSPAVAGEVAGFGSVFHRTDGQTFHKVEAADTGWWVTPPVPQHILEDNTMIRKNGHYDVRGGGSIELAPSVSLWLLEGASVSVS